MFWRRKKKQVEQAVDEMALAANPELSEAARNLMHLLLKTGREDEARAMFERLLARRNHLGLLSEDLAFDDGEAWGNFPQTYSHVGLIIAAMRLSRSWQEAS